MKVVPPAACMVIYSCKLPSYSSCHTSTYNLAVPVAGLESTPVVYVSWLRYAGVVWVNITSDYHHLSI